MQEMDLNELINDQSNKTNDDNVFTLENSQFDLPLRIKSFNSAKEFEKFIRSSEKLVRYSPEYRLWIKYITDHLNQSKCALTNEKITECPLEIHHHPITLYTIVKSVVNDYISKEKEFSTFDIATSVIELHFQNKVGFIVLLSDLHSKYHSGFLNLPIDLVNGDYKFILQNYSIDENEYDKICGLCSVKMEDMPQIWTKDNYPGLEEIKKQKQLEENNNKQLNN